MTIDEAMRQIDAHVNRVVRKVSLQALNGVVLKTPVDTGRARGNWGVGINNRPNGTSENTDLSGGATISAGQGEIAGAKTYGEVYITNNLPYIGKLESGSSQQAPSGMVGVTVAEIEAQARALAKG